MIVVRALTPLDAQKIIEIDRSERVTLGYRYENGALVSERVDWEVPSWSMDGHAEFNLQGRIEDVRFKIQHGDCTLGAFDEYRLAGFAILHLKLTEELAQLSDLFVDRAHRRRGIAAKLVAEIRNLARESGARGLSVSSVPSESAVGFYLNQGFRPAQEPHPKLFELEPEDIHMILRL